MLFITVPMAFLCCYWRFLISHPLAKPLCLSIFHTLRFNKIKQIFLSPFIFTFLNLCFLMLKKIKYQMKKKNERRQNIFDSNSYYRIFHISVLSHVSTQNIVQNVHTKDGGHLFYALYYTLARLSIYWENKK